MKIIRKGDEKERKRREMGVVECDWCHEEFSKENTKFWITGARVCHPCFDSGSQEQEKIRDEYIQETQRRRGSLDFAGW